MEKTKSQDIKVKENIDHGSQKDLQKMNSEDSTIVKLNDPVNIKMDTTIKSDIDGALNPLNDKTVDNSLKTE